jgi:hypothetical protein
MNSNSQYRFWNTLTSYPKTTAWSYRLGDRELALSSPRTGLKVVAVTKTACSMRPGSILTSSKATAG